MHKKLSFTALGLIIFIPSSIIAFANMYFAHPYPFGTRFERKGLVTIDAWFAHGNTKNGRDADGKKTNVLQIYGKHTMHQVGKNVENENLTSTSETILDTLWRHTPTTNDSNYGVLEFTGKANYSGGSVSFGLNITNELFIGGEVPFYSLKIDTPTFVDKTADADKDAEWNQFFAAFDDILSDVGLSRLGIKQNGLGDISFFGGWTRSTDELENLDFLDATLKVGGLLGTANGKNEDYAFSIAPGYDKHSGFFVSFDMAFGFAECVSMGFHLQELFLFKKLKNMRVKSALGQNGFIKLAKTDVTRDMGNIYKVGGHGKVEYGASSFFVGYTYCHKGADSLTAKNSTLYPGSTLNSDTMTKEWSMHTLHAGAEIDLTNNEERKIHPKFGIHYNYVLRARRAFDNSTLSGSIGIAVSGDF